MYIIVSAQSNERTTRLKQQTATQNEQRMSSLRMSPSMRNWTRSEGIRSGDPSVNTPHPENVENLSIEGSESSCVNEHGEPIYSKPDMSKKLNRNSTMTEIDYAASLSPGADSAIGECEEGPPSVPRKADVLLE